MGNKFLLSKYQHAGLRPMKDVTDPKGWPPTIIIVYLKSSVSLKKKREAFLDLPLGGPIN